MSSSTNDLPLLSVGQTGKELAINAMMSAVSPAALFGRAELQCVGLTLAVHGGAYNGAIIPLQAVTLPASATCYVEADAAGVLYVSTAGWTSGRLRLYTVVTGATSQTSWVDYRQTIGAAGTGGGGGVALDNVNVFTRAQGVSPVKVAAATGAVALDLSQSNVFRLTLTGNVTLSVASPGDGFVYTLQITQDATGGRTMAWPAKFRWPGGVVGALSTSGGAVDLLSAVYDADADRYDVVLNKNFA